MKDEQFLEVLSFVRKINGRLEDVDDLSAIYSVTLESDGDYCLIKWLDEVLWETENYTLEEMKPEVIHAINQKIENISKLKEITALQQINNFLEFFIKTIKEK